MPEGRDSEFPDGNSLSRPSGIGRSEEHTSELQSHLNLVCRLLLEKKKHMRQLFLHLTSLVRFVYQELARNGAERNGHLLSICEVITTTNMVEHQTPSDSFIVQRRR